MSVLEKIRKLKIRRKTYFFINITLLILLATVFLNDYIKPSVFSYFGFTALIFPLLFAIYIFVSCIWFFRKIKYAIFFLALSLFFIVPFKRTFNFLPKKKEKLTETFKVISFNTRYTYDIDIKKLENYLVENKADIVFLQEIYSRQWKDSNAFFSERNNAVYGFVGISTIYPIVNSKQVPIPFNGYSCMADIMYKNDTIRLLNVYLNPMYLTKKLFEFNSTSELTDKTVLLKNKLAEGFKIHQKQVEVIKKYIDESPYPIIVSGDFNSVPNSYEYYQMTQNLTDSFEESGEGLGTTFHDYYYPLKIDYILYDKNFSSENCTIDRTKKYSDHFPISVNLQYNKVKM